MQTPGRLAGRLFFEIAVVNVRRICYNTLLLILCPIIGIFQNPPILMKGGTRHGQVCRQKEAIRFHADEASAGTHAEFPTVSGVSHPLRRRHVHLFRSSVAGVRGGRRHPRAARLFSDREPRAPEGAAQLCRERHLLDRHGQEQHAAEFPPADGGVPSGGCADHLGQPVLL